MPLVVLRQKHCHGIWITPISQQVSLFLRNKGEKGRESRSINTKNIGCIAKNLADAFFSGLLSSFLSLQCGTGGSNEESGLPHDQLLQLSNSTPPTSCQRPFTLEHQLSSSFFALPAVLPVRCCCKQLDHQMPTYLE